MNKTFLGMAIFSILLVGCEGSSLLSSSSFNYALCKGDGYDYDPSAIDDYELVWEDHFDGDSLNLDNWSYQVGGSGWGNNELQYYTEGNNVSVSEGKLTIQARKEDVGGRAYTSSRIRTANKKDFLYGKVDILAKMPPGRGTWAALWMMPTDSRYGIWPRSGEIDIAEFVGYDPNRTHATVHTLSYNHKNNTQQGASRSVENLTSEFHLYSIEWLPDRIEFFVDGIRIFRFFPGLFLTCPKSSEWPFDQRFHFIFNIAIGGDWGGVQGVDDTIFPTEMIVDYIQVYQSAFVSELRPTW